MFEKDDIVTISMGGVEHTVTVIREQDGLLSVVDERGVHFTVSAASAVITKIEWKE